jgi:hypothetical protein
MKTRLPEQVEIGEFDNVHGCSPKIIELTGFLRPKRCDQWSATSSMRLAKPHSLSNQTKRLTRCGPLVRVWLPSMMAECGS